jgi:flavin-binding protein dodecin
VPKPDRRGKNDVRPTRAYTERPHDDQRQEARGAMGVIIIREMVGSSPVSWSEAAESAVATAARTVRNIRHIEVVRHTARVEDGRIVDYEVELKIHFEYEGG